MRHAKNMTRAILEALKNIELNTQKLEEARAFARRTFDKSLPRGIPAALAGDLFDWVWDEAANQKRPELAGDILDLFAMDYDELGKPLTKEDWDTVNDLVSPYDQDLDMDLLQYLMVQVVENGIFHEE